MRNYTIELKHDNGIFTLKLRARNMAEAINQVMQTENCPFRSIVFRWEGRFGEPTEYVEFDPRENSGVTYVAQFNGEYWNVFENFPGRKGRVTTIDSFNTKQEAVCLAQKLAHD